MNFPDYLTHFTIAGAPVGKGRPKFARRGNFVQAYTPSKTKDYESLVKDAAKKAMDGRQPTEKAVYVTLEILVEPPKSWSKKRRLAAIEGMTYPTTKPDIDNIIKAILDAMNGIVFVDDKQIVSLSGDKRYSDVAETAVMVYEF